MHFRQELSLRYRPPPQVLAYQLNDKTVLRGGWGIAYGFAPDLNVQTTGQSVSSPTGVNAFATLNQPGTIPQPIWPNFSVSQTPLPGSTSSGFLAYLDPGASRPPRQDQWSIGIQREISRNFVLEAAYVGNRGVWWSLPAANSDAYLNQVAPSVFAAYGLSPYTNAADNLLLGSTLASAAVSSRFPNILPYSGYANTNTLFNAHSARTHQFSTIAVTNSPTGKRLLITTLLSGEEGTKRLSRGLQVNGTFTWSKAMVSIRPNLFVESNKSLQPTDQPFVFNANIVYTTQTYFANRILALATRRHSCVRLYLQYGSGLPLTPPAATSTNYIGGSEQFRVPGQPLYLKGLNCGCINPYQDQVLNPAAWVNPANGDLLGPATRNPLRRLPPGVPPAGELQLRQNLPFQGVDELQRSTGLMFVNIFNCYLQIGNPNTWNPLPALGKPLYTSGFGTINLVVSGPNVAPGVTANAVVGQLYQLPRTGTIDRPLYVLKHVPEPMGPSILTGPSVLHFYGYCISHPPLTLRTSPLPVAVINVPLQLLHRGFAFFTSHPAPSNWILIRV